MIHKEGKDRIRATYLDNYDRLLELKNKYGPANEREARRMVGVLEAPETRQTAFDHQLADEAMLKRWAVAMRGSLPGLVSRNDPL